MSIANDLADYVSIWDKTGDFQTYARAIGQMFVEVEGYAEDTDTTVGWQALWDVDTAPTGGLPWLAMVMGETLPQGVTDAQARALIRAAPNQDRGSPQAVADAIKQVLTGGQLVGIREGYRGDGTADLDSVAIATWANETPSQNAVLAAIRRTLPFDINPYYTCLTANTWATIQGGRTWANIQTSDGPTWGGIQAHALLAGYDIY